MSEPRCATLALALALGLATGGAAAADTGVTDVLADAAGAIGLFSRPSTQPGHPERLGAVLVVHDSFGFDRRSEIYARQLLGASLAVLEVELQAFPGDGGGPAEAEPAPDRVRRAVAALAANPKVDPARIGALGFGEGARALLLETAPIAFAARVLLYPGCGALLPALTDDGPPEGRASGATLLMHGTADPANTPDDCADLARLLAEQASMVRVMSWPEATYAWDVPQGGGGGTSQHPAPGGGPPVPMQGWPELADLSAARTAAFLDAALAHGRP